MDRDFLKTIQKKIENELDGFPLLDNRYHLLVTIETGRFGKVKLAFDSRKKEFLAIKLLKQHSSYLAFEHFYNEICVLCQHRGVKEVAQIKDFNFQGCLKNNGVRYTVMYYTQEFYPTGELFKLLKIDTRWEELEKLYLVKKTFQCVSFLFQNKIYHGDLKPENLLVNSQMQIVVCDFGTC